MSNDQAVAYVHSLRGEKSALIGVKKHELEVGWKHCYVPRKAVSQYVPMVNEEGEKSEEYDTFKIPNNFTLEDMRDEEGAVRTTKNGEPLKVISFH